MHAPQDRSDVIETVLDRIQKQDRVGVLITGEVGVGKSFLVDRIAAVLAADGHEVRRMRGAGAGDLPLGGLARSFRDVETDSGPAPVISMKRFLETSDAPMTIVADDVDLLDAQSLAILIEVASAGLATLLLTLRTGRPIPPAVEHEVTGGGLYRVECAPLDRRASAALADQFAGRSLGSARQHKLFELSRGNPLFLRELIEVARLGESIDSDEPMLTREGGPLTTGRLVDLLEQRLRTLGAAERDALTRLALVGPVGHGEMSGFVGDDTLVSLERRNLVTSSLDGRRMLIEVAHPLDGEIIRSTASVLFARGVRTEHAERLWDLGARRRRDRLRLATWALDGISAVDTVVLAEAARMAATAGDPHLSRRCAEAAFEQDSTPESAHLLGVMLTAVGDNDALRDHLPRWKGLATTPSHRSHYEILSANTRYWRWADHDAIDELVETASAWSHPESKVALQAAAASQLVTTGRIDDAVELAEELDDVPPGIAAVHVTLALGHGRRAQGKPNSAEAIVAESLDFFRSISDDAFLISDVAMAGLLIQTLSEAGRFVELDRLTAERSESWNDLAKTPTAALVLLAQASAWFVRGEYDRAVGFATDGRDRFDEIRQTGMARWCRIMIALAHAEPGRVEQADPILREIDANGDHPAQIFESSLMRARAWIHHHRGDSAKASELLLSATHTTLTLGNVAAAVECLHDLARHGSAAAAAARLDDITTEQLEGKLYAARCAHILALASGDVRALGACMADFDRLGLRHLAAEVALVIAASPSVTNTEAKRWLRRASERSGARDIDFSRFRAHQSLTSREREVTALAVEGLTSREIADRLRVSRRTIEAHLGSAYSKLNVDGRIGLIEHLVRPR